MHQRSLARFLADSRARARAIFNPFQMHCLFQMHSFSAMQPRQHQGRDQRSEQQWERGGHGSCCSRCGRCRRFVLVAQQRRGQTPLGGGGTVRPVSTRGRGLPTMGRGHSRPENTVVVRGVGSTSAISLATAKAVSLSHSASTWGRDRGFSQYRASNNGMR